MGATGIWSDTFTIDGGSLNGQLGHLVAGFRVDGMLSYSYDDSVNFQAELAQEFRTSLRLNNSAAGQTVELKGGARHTVIQGNEAWPTPSGFTDFSTPGLYTIELDFKFGTPISIDLWGDATVRARAFATENGPANIYYPDSVITATADFGHTMYWAGFVSLTDSLGAAVNNYAVTLLSGFDYRYSAALVPVPANFALMLSGLSLIAVMAVRRKSNLSA